jgi:SanA protein
MKIRLNKNRVIILFLLIFLLYFLPQLLLISTFNSRIYDSALSIPQKEYGIVFGARIYSNGQLSEAAAQRADTAIKLYELNKIKHIFVSGTNRANYEVDTIASYILAGGVSNDDIYRDYYGIDTNDTCKHFYAAGGKEAILITQKFHLPRASFMCSRSGINVLGANTNKISPSAFEIFIIERLYIKASRFLTESFLTWAYLIGYYDYHSSEAESIAPIIKPL